MVAGRCVLTLYFLGYLLEHSYNQLKTFVDHYKYIFERNPLYMDSAVHQGLQEFASLFKSLS